MMKVASLVLCWSHLQLTQLPMHTSVSNIASSGLGYGVQFIKEQDARGGCPGLVKHVTHVSLGLAKPHSQQFRTLGSGEEGRGGEGRGGEGRREGKYM